MSRWSVTVGVLLPTRLHCSTGTATGGNRWPSQACDGNPVMNLCHNSDVSWDAWLHWPPSQVYGVSPQLLDVFPAVTIHKVGPAGQESRGSFGRLVGLTSAFHFGSASINTHTHTHQINIQRKKENREVECLLLIVS